jgi:hypothetical protein
MIMPSCSAKRTFEKIGLPCASAYASECANYAGERSTIHKKNAICPSPIPNRIAINSFFQASKTDPFRVKIRRAADWEITFLRRRKPNSSSN